METRIGTLGDAVRGLLAGYAPRNGVPDELLAPGNVIRPVWGPFIDHLAGLSHEDLQHNISRGDRYLRDAGVHYRHYAEPDDERDWPLSHVPVLIHEDEWRTLADGLIQRADLLEKIVADLYGDNLLVADGHLPASLIAASPEWLRPLVGVKPRGNHFLNFVGFEIGRGPNGDWWVLGDRTQAPSGAGFALETRVATARIFSEFLSHSRIHRLAGFFREFRDVLNGLKKDPSGRVAILTPGQHNETYFEHAYIARYLGFSLLEGEDLVVQGGRLMVRTVRGLIPAEVVWRRLDAAFADPLELNEKSFIGTPGLVSAVRDGSVTMVNALGTGVLETRALLAFIPQLCQRLLGEPLKLPNIATWWCGQYAEREYVRTHAAHMMLGEALSTSLPFDSDDHSSLGGRLRGKTASALDELIAQDGASIVGQEQVTLSTTPALVDGVLQPRPMVLRMFLARTESGWSVMPGGYARIGRSEDPAAIAMRRGGSVADVWVISDNPVAQDTMLAQPPGKFNRAAMETLPSRAADNLFWLGRYVERAECDMRLLRSYHLRLSESTSADNQLLEAIEKHLENGEIDPLQTIPDGFLSTLDSTIFSASKIRDRFSMDGWMAITDLAKTAKRFKTTVKPGDDAARAMSVLLRKVSGFSGLVHENMYRFVGWRFLSIGRALERAQFMTRMLQTFAAADAPDGALDLAIELGDSIMTHRRRYSVTTTRETVVDLLALDPMNPRAILFTANDLEEHVRHLPGANEGGHLSPLSRAVLDVQRDIAVHSADEITVDILGGWSQKLWGVSELLTRTYLK